MPLQAVDMPAYAAHVVMLESGGRASARNPRSSAGGLHQFTKPTWEAIRHAHPELGLTANGRFDAAQSTRAFRLFTEDNARILAKAMGRSPDEAELYLAHWLGSLGAVTTLKCAAREAAGGPAVKARGRSCAQIVAHVRAVFRNKPAYTVDEAKWLPRQRATTKDLNDQELARVREAAEAILSNN